MAIFNDSIAKSRIYNPTKAYSGAFLKIVNALELLTFFVKKPHHKCSTVFQKRLCCL